MSKQKRVSSIGVGNQPGVDWEAYARGVLACVTSGVVLADATGQIVDCNSALEALFGYEPGELRGKRISVLMPPYEAQHHDRYMRAFLETRESEFVGRGPRELVAQRKDGTNFSINIAVQLVEMSGTPLFIAAIEETHDEISGSDLSLAADHDLLTGLHNAYYFEREFERLLSRVVRGQAEPCALLYLDIDQFRGFNERFGHSEGDRLLNEYGSQLARRCRKSDLAARLHDDKFAVLLFGIKDEFFATVSEAFRTRLQSYRVGDESVSVSVTAILVALDPSAGDYRKTMAAAEKQCQEAKSKGGGLSVICTN